MSLQLRIKIPVILWSPIYSW